MWVAALAVSLIGFGALVTDVGSLYEERRQLQTKADAAALAAARELALGNGVEAANTEAARFSSANPSNNPDSQDFQVNVNFDGQDVAVSINETITKDSGGLFLAPVLGFTGANISAKARAAWGPPGASLGNLVPFTVFEGDLPESFPGPETSIYPHEKNTPPGGFGLIDFDEANNSNSKFEKWIVGGYGKLVRINRWIDQGPGLRASMEDAVETRMARDPKIVIPVYNAYESQGANGQYFVVGFAAFRVESVDFRGNDKALTGYFETGTTPGPILPPGPTFGVSAVSLTE